MVSDEVFAPLADIRYIDMRDSSLATFSPRSRKASLLMVTREPERHDSIIEAMRALDKRHGRYLAILDYSGRPRYRHLASLPHAPTAPHGSMAGRRKYRRLLSGRRSRYTGHAFLHCMRHRRHIAALSRPLGRQPAQPPSLTR